jgi:hypothetical protein
MNHGITSTDPDNGETPYGGGEFIDKYVFPHGELPTSATCSRPCSKAAGSVRRGKPAPPLRPHLRHLDRQFRGPRRAGARAGGDKRYRIWHVYLAGCAYAFEQDWISLYQIVGRKAGQRSAALPWSRQHMYRLPQAIRVRLPELVHLGRHHEGAVALQRMLAEVILVVVLGRVKHLGRRQFGDDGRIPHVGHLGDDLARHRLLLRRRGRSPSGTGCRRHCLPVEGGRVVDGEEISSRSR